MWANGGHDLSGLGLSPRPDAAQSGKSRYARVSDITFRDGGSSIASVMPPVEHGISEVVIPGRYPDTSAKSGLHTAFDPAEPGARQLAVYEKMGSNPFPLDTARLDKNQVSAVLDELARSGLEQQLIENGYKPVEAKREVTLRAMRRLSELQSGDVVEPAAAAAPVPNLAPPPAGAWPPPQQAPSMTPMPKAPPGFPSYLAGMQRQVPAAPAAPRIPDPTVGVVFSIHGFGRTTAYYHEVVVSDEGRALLLCYRAGYNLHKFFPEPAPAELSDVNNLPTVVAQIVGHPVQYALYVPGITFRTGEQEICLLMIMNQQPLAG